MVFSIYSYEKPTMTYFRRSIDEDLRAWSLQPDHTPLVLRGARQTGKTAAVRYLGETFDLFVELNLERYADRAMVQSCTSADELLEAVKVRLDLERFPDRTLLFLDEVQESAEAIGWLRFLYEDHPGIHVIAAGSLMEVRLQQRGFSFPVGRVTFRYLHPLSFVEFLWATGRGVLAESLRGAAADITPCAPAIHEMAGAAFGDYLVVGGMPEAVLRWCEDDSPVTVRQVHGDLVQAMAEDIHKYRGVRDMAPLESVFAHLPHHYGMRFKYERFAPGWKSHQAKTALERLESAMVCRRVWPTSDLAPPLAIKQRSAPKLVPLDIGVALTTMGVSIRDMKAGPLDGLRDGRVAEAVVGQLLLSTHRRTDDDLHFWVRETARANAEVDYLLAGAGGLLPVEVKAGASGTLRSMHQFLARAGGSVGIRLHGGEWADEEHEVATTGAPLTYRLLSLPLYMAEFAPVMHIQCRDDPEP
jgi:uncharacterized protein